MVVAPEPNSPSAVNHESQDLIRAQMERLLRSAHFRNSKRYPTLLRYLVEETLEGHTALLKERVLGIEVFGRAPDYDTAADPIVRVTIAEIRKRIAQYYHEDAHHSELRIELTPGSYVPLFVPGRDQEEQPSAGLLSRSVTPLVTEPSAASLETIALPLPAPAIVHQQPKTRRASRRLWYGGAVLLFILAAAAAFGTWRLTRPTPLDQLWSPVLLTRGPVTFCIPMSVRKQHEGSARTTSDAIAHATDLAGVRLPATGSFADHELLGENVVFSDVQAMMKLQSAVERQHRAARVRLNFGTNLNELREGPSIFIGGLDNQWTLRLIGQLRYRFAGSDAGRYYIQDTKAPGNEQWSVRLHDKYTSVMQDYAIVARVHSNEMGEPVLILAGIGMSGTAAAGEFLADPAQLAELNKRLGGNALRDRDFEAVLQTDVVNGIAGPAKIVAVDTP